MRAAIVALVTAIALVTSAFAQTAGKVLVLPLDGNTPDAQRTALNASVAKLARNKMSGDVTVGETTFNETAAAVGCDPALASCAEQVRTTLAVDELVYGTANTENGTTTVTVNRVAAGTPPKTQISVISESDAAESAEGGMEPLFTTAAEGDGSGSGSGSGSAERARPGSSFFDTRERKMGVAFGAGGVISLVIGLSFWSGASGLQSDIDDAPRSTLAEINALEDLEDRAASKALWGNVFVVVGLVATGVGGYYLWKDHKNRSATTLTPAPTESGAGMTLVLRGSW